MVRFRTELDVTPIGERRWRVNAPLVADTPFGAIAVPGGPRGFVTDGASVPQFLWALYPPMDGDYDAAAVLHDYAYKFAEQLQLNRAQADALLRDGMVATGTGARKRFAIYQGVRLGGWAPWRKHRAAAAAIEVL